MGSPKPRILTSPNTGPAFCVYGFARRIFAEIFRFPTKFSGKSFVPTGPCEIRSDSNLGTLFDFTAENDAVELNSMTTIDLWALAQTNIMIEEVSNAFERFELHRAVQIINRFCSGPLSSTYHDISRIVCTPCTPMPPAPINANGNSSDL